MHILVDSTAAADARIVAAQMGRKPRQPWRTAVRCGHGRPSVIASPSTLGDGTPFPTLYWLTCPWLVRVTSDSESAGETARWARRAEQDPAVQEALAAVDADFRDARRQESGGHDSCESTGIAGQRDPLGIKCLHAHVALTLTGMHDPIGASVVTSAGAECPDDECARLSGMTT